MTGTFLRKMQAHKKCGLQLFQIYGKPILLPFKLPSRYILRLFPVGLGL